MYTAQTTKERIKGLCKIQKVSMEQMLSELNLGVNAVRQITDTKGMSSVSLYRIADYLNCSVDYLLGRTDNPEIRTDGSINIGNIGNNSNNNNHIQVSPETETQQEISSILSHLSFRERTELMTLIYKYFDEHNKGV